MRFDEVLQYTTLLTLVVAVFSVAFAVFSHRRQINAAIYLDLSDRLHKLYQSLPVDVRSAYLSNSEPIADRGEITAIIVMDFLNPAQLCSHSRTLGRWSKTVATHGCSRVSSCVFKSIEPIPIRLEGLFCSVGRWGNVEEIEPPLPAAVLRNRLCGGFLSASSTWHRAVVGRIGDMVDRGKVTGNPVIGPDSLGEYFRNHPFS